MTLKVTTIQDTSSNSRFTIDSSTGEVNLSGSNNIQYEVVGRPNDALEENVLLDTFTQIHQYNTSGSTVYCHTGLVENAMYELTWQSSGGSANIDWVLYPAGRRGGADVFRSNYRATQEGDGNFNSANQSLNRFYIDHQFGGSGTEGFGKIFMYTGARDTMRDTQHNENTNPRSHRRMFYCGGDRRSVAHGYARWLNVQVTQRQEMWDWVGVLEFNGDNKRVWVRRIG